ncbi:MAG: hypothetical protein LBF22_03180 [Deltaproteobacteria bacterium]|jgi:hypothetical protein|nr:hypothetical protein [Deltaproteobacteria bacterium]
MPKPFIQYKKRKGQEYASIHLPSWKGGKKANEIIPLGKVIDKEQAIFESKAKGVFQYDLEYGYIYFQLHFDVDKFGSEPIVTFGDLYLLYKVLKKYDYLELFWDIYPESPYHLFILIFFCVLANTTLENIDDWLIDTYAQVLFNLQEIGKLDIHQHLNILGTDPVSHDFFKRYHNLIPENNAIVIDSAIFADDCEPFNSQKDNLQEDNPFFDNLFLDNLTMDNPFVDNSPADNPFEDNPPADNPIEDNPPAANQDELLKNVRILYAVDKTSKRPIFFRYIAANNLDIVALERTTKELKLLDINIDYVVLANQHYNKDNIKYLFENNINFIAKLIPDRLIYNELLPQNVNTLISCPNKIIYNDRLLFGICTEINQFENKHYAYIFIDFKKYSEELINFYSDINNIKHLSDEEIDDINKTFGTFILISSLKVTPDEILKMYYEREIKEQILQMLKYNSNLCPPGEQSLESIKGTLLISFMSLVSYFCFEDNLSDSKYSAKMAFYILRHLFARLFYSKAVISNPDEDIRKLFNIFDITIPEIIEF